MAQINPYIHFSSLLMGSDTPEFMGKQNENENRSKISVSAESREEADQIFNGLSAAEM